MSDVSPIAALFVQKGGGQRKEREVTRKTATNVHLTAHQTAELSRLSALHGRSRADLIREGVDMVIEDLGGVVEDPEADSRTTPSTAPLSARVAALEERLAAVEGRVNQ